MRVLLTGGSGFLGAHCVDQLLQRGHDVVFTVRSEEKGEAILKTHKGISKDRLSYTIVKDIAQQGAFDDAVKSNPPFEAVLHTASPFHFNLEDPKKDMLNPAVMGTTGILESIKKSAPAVKIVVITSSFAAIFDAKRPEATFSESDWNSITWDEASGSNAVVTTRGSKTFAEKAAWGFVQEEKPNFQIATINPPAIFGPVIHHLNSLGAINTSNLRVLDMIQGKQKDGLSPSGPYLWVDVRDCALAHVKAMEIPEAHGKRFFVVEGHFSNAEIAQVIKDNFPEYRDKLPSEVKSDIPSDIYNFNNKRSKEILGIKYRPLKECIVDLVKSLKAAGAE